MTGDRNRNGDDRPGPRDVEGEFARMLEREGLHVRPGQAPREPAAPEPPEPFDDDTPPEPDDESRARARAAHPSAGPPQPAPGDHEPPRDADDDPASQWHPDDDDPFLAEDFVPPDPDLPEPASGALWAWAALIGGLTLLLATTFSAALPTWLAWIGVLTFMGGLVALLMRVPQRRRDDGDGAQV